MPSSSVQKPPSEVLVVEKRNRNETLMGAWKQDWSTCQLSGIWRILFPPVLQWQSKELHSHPGAQRDRNDVIGTHIPGPVEGKLESLLLSTHHVIPWASKPQQKTPQSLTKPNGRIRPCLKEQTLDQIARPEQEASCFQASARTTKL